jgi:hypothetical protein
MQIQNSKVPKFFHEFNLLIYASLPARSIRRIPLSFKRFFFLKLTTAPPPQKKLFRWNMKGTQAKNAETLDKL